MKFIFAYLLTIQIFYVTTENLSFYSTFLSVYLEKRGFKAVTFIHNHKYISDLFTISQNLSRDGVRVSISDFPTSFHGTLLHVLYFNDAQVYFGSNALRQASEQNYLNAEKHWLIITHYNNTKILNKVLSPLRCLVDCDLFVAEVKQDIIVIKEVYNTGIKGIQIINNVGFWNKVYQNNISVAALDNYLLDITELQRTYKYHRRGNLHGLKLRIGMVTVNKMYCIVEQQNNQTIIVGGYACSVFEHIEKSLNFKGELQVLPGYAYGVYTKDNDSWSGLAGVLQRGEVDMTGCELSANVERQKHMEFSQPLQIIGRRIYYKRSEKEFHADAFLRPFSANIWYVLCVTLPVVAGLAYLLGFCSPFRTAAESVDSYTNHFFGLLSALLLQGWPDVYSDSPRRALLGTAMITYLVVSVSYSAKMVALRTAEKPSIPISTLEDVYDKPDWDFGFVAAALERNYFEGADGTTLLGKMWQRIKGKSERSLVTDVTSGLQRALDKKFVFLGFHWSCQEILALKFSEDDACRLQVINDKDYFKGGIAFGLPKDSPYKELIDYKLQGLRETGVLDRLLRESSPKSAVCEAPPFTMITLVDVAPALMLLACGAVTSMIILVLEMICVIRKRRHKKQVHFKKLHHKLQ